jgi:hypothetical protein
MLRLSVALMKSVTLLSWGRIAPVSLVDLLHRCIQLCVSWVFPHFIPKNQWMSRWLICVWSVGQQEVLGKQHCLHDLRMEQYVPSAGWSFPPTPLTRPWCRYLSCMVLYSSLQWCHPRVWRQIWLRGDPTEQMQKWRLGCLPRGLHTREEASGTGPLLVLPYSSLHAVLLIHVHRRVCLDGDFLWQKHIWVVCTSPL